MRGRFAPSPTGRLHLGNAWSALWSWLWVRSVGGQFLLRIEDLDRARCRAGFVDSLLFDLEYLGLLWDEPPLFQSQREEAYRLALEELGRQGRTYACACSRADIAAAASAPHGDGDDGPRYPGTCRGLSSEVLAEKARKRPLAVRFAAAPGVTAFEDALFGHVEQDVAQAVGDFVVRRNDGVMSYQLAVVVDDAFSNVTHVLRGQDLLSSTPRQLQLYQALGLRAPAFAHVPLLFGEDGKRLAKREGAFAVATLREQKVPPEQVIGYFARLAGLTDGTPTRAEALASTFSLDKLPRSPVRVTHDEVSRALGL